IFNTAVKFNSYRGPIQSAPRTRQAIYDCPRVALREFGHSLGLAHPDEHGQNVVALMNSIISDLDHLADDDIAGGRFLYGVRITSSLGSLSVQAGDFFKYQITANNTPVSYEATGLPPGLALDSNSGSISGSPTLAGSFTVAIVAHGTPADASGTLQIVVLGPRITSNLNPPSVFVGSSFAYHVTSTNNPFAYDATGLPAGLTLDRSSGVISGTPTSIGTFSVIVTAHCTLGDASGTLHITVLGPRITSNLYPPNVLVGDPFVYQITSTNNPFAFDATGLPAGLTLDRNSGVINGTPTSIGTFFVIITAHCGPGDASGTLSITVLPYNITSSPYPFPSPLLASDFKYQITANNSPASYGAIGLPPGLQVDSTTGLITGVPTLTGTYQFTVIAHGPKGDAVGTVRVTVVAALPL